jgi:hypothetical protein
MLARSRLFMSRVPIMPRAVKMMSHQLKRQVLANRSTGVQNMTMLLLAGATIFSATKTIAEAEDGGKLKIIVEEL